MEEFEMKRLLIALLFVISLTSFSTMVNLPIKSVEVVNNQQVPASLIKETLKLKEGARFSTEALLADFNALKETGYFEDVILQPISYDGGVRIVVDVVEKENVVDLLKEKGVAVNTLREDTDKSIVISSVKFIGNKRVTTSELLDITQLKAGEYFSRSRVEDAQRRLLATGKFSEVRPDAQVSNGKMALSFEVAENPIVKSIVITGNHTIPTSTIMSALTTKPGSVQNYNNLREDRDKILGLYQAQGYTLVNITDMSTDENGTLHISIVEGVMGLYDGMDNSLDNNSSAHIARFLGIPVILVLDGIGKSTLTKIIMAHPDYKLESGKIYFDDNLINDKEVDEIAKMGIFVSFQNPIDIDGVTNNE